MKTLIKQTKSIALILSLIIIFLSCIATYHDSCIEVLYMNSKKNKRVIIETKDNLTLEYNSIRLNDSIFLGTQRMHGKRIETPINLENIKSVTTKSKVLLNVVEVIGVIVITGLIVTYLYGKYIAGWDELQ
jgi:hypothetical protein